MVRRHFNKHQQAYQYLLLVLLCYVIFLLKLGSFHMRFWDESMFAVNTYEMMKNGEYFALFFDGRPDLFNTKPPLTIWAQLASVKLFGYNELAIRLPSAVASIISVLALFRFLSKQFSNQLAWIAVLILMTTQGYVGFHTSRTGDSDALLSCLLLLANLQIFTYLLQKHKRAILWFFLFLTLATLTKLFAAFLFLPGILVLLIWQKELKKILFSWQFALGAIGFLSISSLVIYLREAANPGYLAIAFGKDAGRIFEVVEDHQESTFYYIDLLFNNQFSLYALLLIIGLILMNWSSEKFKPLLIGMAMMLLSYLLIISISVTKLHWYTMPLFPVLAVLAAYPIHIGLQSTTIKGKAISGLKKSLIICCLFIYPFIIMFSKSQGNSIAPADIVLESKELYLFNAIKQKKNLDGLKILHHNWKGSLLFYKYKLAENNQTITIETDMDKLKLFDKVLVSNDSLRKSLKARFPNSEISGSYEYADVFELKP